MRNKSFWIIAIFFGLMGFAQNIGYVLLPNFLAEGRGFSQSTIGILFSVSFAGTFFFNLLIEKIKPRLGFTVLVVSTWVAVIFLWGFSNPMWVWVAFFLFGGMTTLWIVKMASVGRVVTEDVQGLAFGVAEALTFFTVSIASGMAGWLYGLTPSHGIPLLTGVIAIPVAFLGWFLYVRRVTGEPPA
jgi:predicted MFS family arabinose efflux permease